MLGFLHLNFIDFRYCICIAPFLNGVGTSSTFNYPIQLTSDTLGSLYIVDRNNYLIRRIATNGIVSSVAGTQGSSVLNTLSSNGDNGPATSTSFYEPTGICLSGNQLYIVDGLNVWIRVVNIDSGIISTLAGSGSVGTVDGTGTSALLAFSRDCAMVNSNVLVFAENDSGKVRSVTVSTKVVTTLGSSMPGVYSIWVD